jgi:nucleoredoxin
VPKWIRAAAGRKVLAVTLFSWLALGCESPVAPPPPAALPELFGSSLLLADGRSVGIEALAGKAIIAIYFGARGCPACAVFTPRLAEVYEGLRAAGRSFEVVYVSSDGSAESMHRYMQDAGMGWLALPWGGSHAAALGQRYDVRWIPTVIVIDGAGATVSMTGREEIAELGAAAYDDWLARSEGR